MSDWADDEEYERAEAEAAAKARRGVLVVIDPDGQVREVPCSYEGIKAGLNEATFDFVAGRTVGCYVDDEGMLTAETLNIPVSMMFGRPLYGPAVLCAAQPDDFGNTLAPPEEAVAAAQQLAEAWRYVVAGAAQIGQDVFITADFETLPPPKVVSLTEEAFARWMETGEMPDE